MRSAQGWRRYLPGLDVLLHYDRSWLRGDVLGGLTVCAYLIPQVMAYAQIAGLPRRRLVDLGALDDIMLLLASDASRQLTGTAISNAMNDVISVP